jgi:hypothetical protein
MMGQAQANRSIGPRGRWRHFSILEMLFAVVALGILTNAALGTLWAVKQAQVPLRQQATALLILDNTLTILATEPTITPDRALLVLQREAAATAGSSAEALTPFLVRTEAGSYQLGLRGPKNQTLAQLELPSCAAAASP